MRSGRDPVGTGGGAPLVCGTLPGLSGVTGGREPAPRPISSADRLILGGGSANTGRGAGSISCCEGRLGSGGSCAEGLLDGGAVVPLGMPLTFGEEKVDFSGRRPDLLLES